MHKCLSMFFPCVIFIFITSFCSKPHTISVKIHTKEQNSKQKTDSTPYASYSKSLLKPTKLENFEVDWDFLNLLGKSKGDHIYDLLQSQKMTCQEGWKKIRWIDREWMAYWRKEHSIALHNPIPLIRYMNACAKDLGLHEVEKIYWPLRWCRVSDIQWYCPPFWKKNSVPPLKWWYTVSKIDRNSIFTILGRPWSRQWNTEHWPREHLSHYQNIWPQQPPSQDVSLLWREVPLLMEKMEKIWSDQWIDRRKVELLFTEKKGDWRHGDKEKRRWQIFPRLKASSALPNYPARHAIDNDPDGRTAWIPHPDDKNPTLSLIFRRPIDLEGIVINREIEQGKNAYAFGLLVEAYIQIHQKNGHQENVAWRLGSPGISQNNIYTLHPLIISEAAIEDVKQIDIIFSLVWTGKSKKRTKIPLSHIDIIKK